MTVSKAKRKLSSFPGSGEVSISFGDRQGPTAGEMGGTSGQAGPLCGWRMGPKAFAGEWKMLVKLDRHGEPGPRRGHAPIQFADYDFCSDQLPTEDWNALDTVGYTMNNKEALDRVLHREAEVTDEGPQVRKVSMLSIQGTVLILLPPPPPGLARTAGADVHRRL